MFRSIFANAWRSDPGHCGAIRVFTADISKTYQNTTCYLRVACNDEAWTSATCVCQPSSAGTFQLKYQETLQFTEENLKSQGVELSIHVASHNHRSKDDVRMNHFRSKDESTCFSQPLFLQELVGAVFVAFSSLFKEGSDRTPRNVILIGAEVCAITW